MKTKSGTSRIKLAERVLAGRRRHFSWRSEETFETTNVHGKRIRFHSLNHNVPNSEWTAYVVEKDVFPVCKWLIYTVILAIIAFYFRLHTINLTTLVLVLLFLCVVLVAKSNLTVKQESLLVVASLGLQVTTTFANGRQTSQFFHLPSVKDVILNEGITMQKVLFYLALIIHDNKVAANDAEQVLVPLFQNTLPRLDCLQKMYKGVQSVLRSAASPKSH